MIDNIRVGKTIAMLRQERGMTQQQLAAALSVSHQAVSKWENGAALPDIQTMMELTRLFGITVEQLISGDIPSVDNEEKPAPKTLDDHLQNIGNFVNNVVDGIFGSNQKNNEADASDAEAPVHVPEDEATEAKEEKSESDIDLQKLLKMAPFMSKDALDSILYENREKLTADDIAKFAPFASKMALDAILTDTTQKFTSDDIAKLAPFLSRSTLEKLIENSDEEMKWETLQKVAPFLKRETVDAWAKAAAKGERIFSRVFGKTDNSPSEFEKSLEDVSRKISAGVEKVARHAQKFGEELVEGLSAAFCDSHEEEKPVNSRAKALRLAALERAIADGRWDWIAAHLSDVQDEIMRGKIAQAAMDQGMTDWLKTNMPEFAVINDAEAALENSDWEAVSAALGNMDGGFRTRAAMKAAQEQAWDWLIENAEKLEFGENACMIAKLAYESDMRETVLNIAETQMDEEEVESLMRMIAENHDYAFAAALSHLVSSECVEDICRRLGETGKWTDTAEFLPMVEDEGIERLMELAISQGDFAAIDLLDDYLIDE